MVFVVWSIESASALATYDTEAGALADVRAAVERHGSDYGAGLALTRENRRGDTRTIAQGTELVDRALQTAPHRSRASRRPTRESA